MQGILQLELKLQNWKDKAKQRRKENYKLKKRAKELIESREGWKGKYKEMKSAYESVLQDHMRMLKGSEKQVQNGIDKKDLSGLKPKHHSYSSSLILMCVWMRQQGNCSLRSCVGMLKVMAVVLGLELKIPCHNSIQNWEKKLGYYRLHKKEESSGSWTIIIDESISIGTEKLLLILGVKLDEYSFKEALCFSDMHLLDMAISNSWKGEQIAERIAGLEADYKIAYAASDGGTNIVKALKIRNINRVSDCTHAFGNLLKKQYNTCEHFKAFSKQCGVFKRQIQQSKFAEYAPPKQRTKGRFLNLHSLSKWAFKVLSLLDSKKEMHSEIVQKLAWLEEYRALIIEIYDQCQTMHELFAVLKKKGLNEKSIKQCQQILKQHKCTPVFQQGVEQYLRINKVFINKLSSLICNSDIIESYFGKYKNISSKNGKSLITDSCLCIANFQQNFSEQQIKKAMEKIKIVDLNKWKEDNCSNSILKKRKQLFKNTG